MQDIRDHYKKLQGYSNTHQYKKINRTEVEPTQKKIDKEIQKCQEKNNFENIAELDFYKEQYAKLNQTIKDSITKKYKSSDFENAIKPILNESPPNQSNAHFGNIESDIYDYEEHQQQQQRQKPAADKTKMSKLAPINENNYRIRNKRNENSDQLRRENQKLKRQLENALRYNDPAELERLREEKERIERKLRELEENSVRNSSPLYFYSKEDQPYDPYHMKVREGNLRKIGQKNQDRVYSTQYSGSDRYTIMDDFKKGYQPQGQQQNHGEDYSFVSYGTLLGDRHMGEQKQINNRNKLAFFKNSMQIANNQHVKIGFKRSEMSRNMDELRCIWFIENSSNQRVYCTINYDFQDDDYSVRVTEPLKYIDPYSIGKEELQVRFISYKSLDSLISSKIKVGKSQFNLSLPAMFIKFEDPSMEDESKHKFAEYSIRPASIFNSLEATRSIVPIRQTSDKKEAGYLYGRCKLCEGLIKLEWRKGKLYIQADERWKLFLSFLFVKIEE